MASTIRFHGPDTGLTVRARLFLDDSTAPITVALTEIGGSTGAGVYAFQFTTQAAGVYGIRFFDNAVAGAPGLLGSGTVVWDGTNIVTEQELVAEVNANQADIATALASLSNLEGFTDTLEAGQSAMTALLNAIQDYVDTLEPAVANLPSAAAIVTALLNTTIEPGATFAESIRLQNAAVNDTTGMETGTGVLKSVDGSKDRVTVTLDQVTGNRAITTRDLT